MGLTIDITSEHLRSLQHMALKQMEIFTLYTDMLAK